MDVITKISGCATGAISLAMAIYVSFTARCKGPIFSNSFMWLSKEEKKRADKKAEYKLLTIVFGELSAAFFFLTINIFTHSKWSYFVCLCFVIFAIIYAVYNTIYGCLKKIK